MINAVLKKIFGTRNERELKRMAPLVDKINSFEPEMKALDFDRLADFTPRFRQRLDKGESIEDLLPEAFAVVREAARRTTGMRHFDVQLIGGVVLHEGRIAEMKTGEGKTLAATLALYINALSGKGAHLVTVNDYLAKRDTRWMGPVYHAMGMTIGVIQHDDSFMFDPTSVGSDDALYQLRRVSRKEAYSADITYGTNNEFGFDYLRDNMKFSLDEYVQRDLNFAIVDEVDSILIDEARTPLIISGPTEDSTDKYYLIDRVIPSLKKEAHFTLDEKSRQVFLTDDGVARVESILNVDNLFDTRHIETLHHVNQALRAHTLFKCDKEYVVKDGQVIIVDEFTGRLMSGRRWSDGLHQAVEAKEHVTIENENQTLATITFQNFFRMYAKLAGMTGTADTEAEEFHSIYDLDITVIPTNVPLMRTDYPDVVYKSDKEKFKAVVGEIKQWREKGRPVLVGTISVENSEMLSKLLDRNGVTHNVLNAKQHEKEADIIAQAGRLKAVTLSTNMAGRGTDIILGGNPAAMAAAKAGKDETTEQYMRAIESARKLCEIEKKEVIGLGGLHIIGTERHESRRIDNQLRGRAGRQGDPGSSRFYVSLEDDLMRIFGSERISSIMDRFGMEEDTPIEHGLVTKAIKNAQKKVEAQNFDIRKHLLEYDDVMNQQRGVVYGYRRQILSGSALRDMVTEFASEVARDVTFMHVEEKAHRDDWDIKALNDNLMTKFGFPLEIKDMEAVKDRQGLVEAVTRISVEMYAEKADRVGEEVFSQLEKIILLHTLDNLWKDHLLSMDHLKGGIGLRGYAQKNPLQEYKREGFDQFAEMILTMKSEVVERLFKVQIEGAEDVAALSPAGKRQKMVFGRGGPEAAAARPGTVRRSTRKIGRNEPCPCGSGKKYKKCHGRAGAELG